MIKEKAFLALPINFKNKCKIYPPLINDVVGNDNFNLYKSLLTTSQEELEDEFLPKLENPKDVPTPIEFLIESSYVDKNFERQAKEAFKFFIKEDVTFIYDRKSILIGDLEKKIQEIKSFDELVFIEENEFFDFQNMVRASMGSKILEPPNPNEDPRVKRIKAKARYRDRIKAKKGGGASFESSLESICCMGIGITPLNIGDLSIAAANRLTERYQERENFELDIEMLLAGGDSKKIKPKHWMRNLE